MNQRALWIALTAILLSGCGGDETPPTPPADTAAVDSAPIEDHAAVAEPTTEEPAPRPRFAGSLDMPPGALVPEPGKAARRNAYFGDLHVHTAYSFDAFAFGTIATPYDAYRFARGEPIQHPAGFDLQLKQPLDFYAVTDHAMFLGAVAAAADTSTQFSELPHVQSLHNFNSGRYQSRESLPDRIKAFRTFLPDTLNGILDGSVDEEMVNAIVREAWADIIRAAQTYNQPGEFTTFVGYEYTTSTDDRGNLHRNVIFRAADKLPAVPFSRFHSQNPEDLWDWMDELRTEGIEAMAIPHNSNGSNGQMFKLVDWAGDPLDDAYGEQRIRNEPLIEITQIKGTSETHPALSDTDEWAGFEIMPYRIATLLHSEPRGSYARDALLRGLALSDQGIENPYQFGFIGSSDTHTAAAPLEEDNYFGKVGLPDADSSLRGATPLSDGDAEIVSSAGRLEVKEIDGNKYASGGYETFSAAGVTGVWAEENSRDAIYSALRRKETFATSGPRLKVRFFAGYGFDDIQLDNAEVVSDAYREGVTMGSELYGEGDRTPMFIAWATRDAQSAALQRLQIVKGWIEDGEHQERVFDVACSDGERVNPITHRCPDNGATVNLDNCSTTPNVGAAQLKTLWQDPGFDPKQRAFYYVRALENPTCRWSTWDAIRAGVAPRPDLATTIQERAWSSPIWFVP